MSGAVGIELLKAGDETRTRDLFDKLRSEMKGYLQSFYDSLSDEQKSQLDDEAKKNFKEAVEAVEEAANEVERQVFKQAKKFGNFFETEDCSLNLKESRGENGKISTKFEVVWTNATPELYQHVISMMPSHAVVMLGKTMTLTGSIDNNGKIGTIEKLKASGILPPEMMQMFEPSAAPRKTPENFYDEIGEHIKSIEEHGQSLPYGGLRDKLAKDFMIYIDEIHVIAVSSNDADKPKSMVEATDRILAKLDALPKNFITPEVAKAFEAMRQTNESYAKQEGLVSAMPETQKPLVPEAVVMPPRSEPLAPVM